MGGGQGHWSRWLWGLVLSKKIRVGSTDACLKMNKIQTHKRILTCSLAEGREKYRYSLCSRHSNSQTSLGGSVVTILILQIRKELHAVLRNEMEKVN